MRKTRTIIVLFFRQINGDVTSNNTPLSSSVIGKLARFEFPSFFAYTLFQKRHKKSGVAIVRLCLCTKWKWSVFRVYYAGAKSLLILHGVTQIERKCNAEAPFWAGLYFWVFQKIYRSFVGIILRGRWWRRKIGASIWIISFCVWKYFDVRKYIDSL